MSLALGGMAALLSLIPPLAVALQAQPSSSNPVLRGLDHALDTAIAFAVLLSLAGLISGLIALFRPGGRRLAAWGLALSGACLAGWIAIITVFLVTILNAEGTL